MYRSRQSLIAYRKHVGLNILTTRQVRISNRGTASELYF